MRKTKTELKAVAIADDVLANKIYEFRGQKVMLDSDLAELYGVETRRLKEM
ncbi:ORF6N domain-containing protein [Sphingobacterium sp. SGR-19]|uniref:ORF6N domain-containing protein n=1 Tax=Sphingobacterium sp. SGR-19 TaxID=2710886 RepID=UPI0021D3A5F7|nr:ORF6N domain-containing protein [Sphingobacterium sp. SGR-19]